MNSQRNLAVFLAGTDSENKIIRSYKEKDQKNIWTKLSLLGQEPTFNNPSGDIPRAVHLPNLKKIN